MKLKEELGLKQDFKIIEHEALLNIYYTSELIKKRAREFFSKYGITDVQFNLMELLYSQADESGGLTQAELSKMMLVNRSNITSLVDRMEKANLVMRTDIPGDRRYNSVRLTLNGKKIVKKVEEKYLEQVTKIMSVISQKGVEELVNMLERIRKVL